MPKKTVDEILEQVKDVPLSEISEETEEEGMRQLEEYIKKFGKLPLSQISGIAVSAAVSKIWEKKPRSNIVKLLMEKSGKSADDIAESLGFTTTYFNNKLQRESFSLDDIIVIAYVCGYVLTFTSNNPDEEERDTFQIDVHDYLEARNQKALLHLYVYEDGLKKKKKEEYDKLKAKLEQMKVEYGFED